MRTESIEALVDKARQHLLASFVYVQQMNEVFSKDTDRALREAMTVMKGLAAEGGDFEDFLYRARTLTRTFFAHVEGTSYVMREVCVWAHERGELELSPDVLYGLSDGEKDEVDGHRRSRFQGLASSLPLACTSFAKAFGVDYRLDKGGVDWSDFRKAIDVRHAVTHPKKIESFHISSEQLGSVQRSMVWFLRFMPELFALCQASHALRRSADQLHTTER